VFRVVRSDPTVLGAMGRQAKASPRQRAEVRKLAAEGVSIRVIAERVFGDRRFRGRVERILRKPAKQGSSSAKRRIRGAAVPGTPAETTKWLRAAFDRLQATIDAGEVELSLREIRSLMDVARRLEAREQLERLRPPQRDR